MALTKTITAGRVSEPYNGAWDIPIKLTIFDDSVEVHSRTFTVQHRTGQDPINRVIALKSVIDEEIAKYIRESNVGTSPGLSTALSWLDSNVTIPE